MKRRPRRQLPSFSQLGQQIRWRPEVNNPVIVWFLGLGQRVAAALTKNLRVAPPPGREERFVLRLRRILASSPLVAEADRVGGIGIQVQVRESFGKPTLVSVDLSLTKDQFDQIRRNVLDPKREKEQQQTYDLLLTDLLERVVQEMWDNPEIAPVGVRGRFIITGDPSGKNVVRRDMRDLGYTDETARPGDLYARLGAPAFDPAWRP